MRDFFWMGGYAFYVWTAYGLAFVVLFWNALHPVLCFRRKARAQTQQPQEDFE